MRRPSSFLFTLLLAPAAVAHAQSPQPVEPTPGLPAFCNPYKDFLDTHARIKSSVGLVDRAFAQIPNPTSQQRADYNVLRDEISQMWEPVRDRAANTFQNGMLTWLEAEHPDLLEQYFSATRDIRLDLMFRYADRCTPRLS